MGLVLPSGGWQSLIISELCLFVNMKQLHFEKSQFMTVFIQIFIKKDLEIEFKMVLFWNSPVLYCISDTKIWYHILMYLISFLYRICDLAHAWALSFIILGKNFWAFFVAEIGTDFPSADGNKSCFKNRGKMKMMHNL